VSKAATTGIFVYQMGDSLSNDYQLLFISFSKAIIHLERMIVEAKSDTKITIEAKTYCKLGHFHLLLEDFPKGRLFLGFLC